MLKHILFVENRAHNYTARCGVYLQRPPRTHTLAPEQKITIAFLTEKDGQMAEKRRKKRPFCLAHLRRGEVYVCYLFLRKKNPTKTNARGRVLWPTRKKLPLPLRDAVVGAIFSVSFLVMKKFARWRLGRFALLNIALMSWASLLEII